MTPSPKTEEENDMWSVFGFRIKKEIDILALFAFIGSLTALGWQGWNALRGPEVSLAPVTQTVFYLKEVDNAFGETGDVLYLAAVNTLYNLGAPGYGDFVAAQTATLTMGSCSITFDAQNIVQLGKSGSDPELPTYQDDWGGLALEHGRASTRAIEFSALFRLRNQELECIKADRLVEELAKTNQATVVYEAQTINETLAQFSCRISDLLSIAE